MPDEGSKTRRHHYISACYLKNFAEPRDREKGRLWAIDKQGKKQWGSTPDGVGHERNFNRIEADGLHPNFIEDMLGNTIETDFPKVISYVERTQRLPKPNGELYSILITMAALFAVRHPTMRGKLEGFQRGTHERYMEAMVSSESIWNSMVRRARNDGESAPEVSYEQARAFVREKRYDLVFPVGYHLKLEFEMQKTVFPPLYDRKWTLMVHECDADFITSSAPINLIATCVGLRSSELGHEIIAISGSDYLRLSGGVGSQ